MLRTTLFLPGAPLALRRFQFSTDFQYEYEYMISTLTDRRPLSGDTWPCPALLYGEAAVAGDTRGGRCRRTRPSWH